jgi:hypothetical protein
LQGIGTILARMRFRLECHANGVEGGASFMSSSKNRRENAWHQRKHGQNKPHGKVKSFEELSQETDGAKS